MTAPRLEAPAAETAAARDRWATLVALAEATLKAARELLDTPEEALRPDFAPPPGLLCGEDPDWELKGFLEDLGALRYNLNFGLDAMVGPMPQCVRRLVEARRVQVATPDADGFVTVHAEYFGSY